VLGVSKGWRGLVDTGHSVSAARAAHSHLTKETVRQPEAGGLLWPTNRS